MSGIMSMVLGAKTAIAQAVDAYFNLVSLLLPGNGTNGAQNNTFLDSSTNNFTITRNGNTTQGTFSPFSQTGWSNYFNGSTDYLTIANNAALNVGSGNFCIEVWFYASTLSGQQIIVSNSGVSGSDNTQIDVNNGNVRFASSATVWLTASGTVTTNSWNHVAVSRSGTTLSLFVNGSRQATATNSTNFANANNYAFTVAAAPGYSAQFTGYVSNFRIVKGSAVYDPTQTSITVPTAPLTAITNTSLLTCQSNRFIDNSTNAFAITPSGTPSVQAFSPFAPTAAYSAATNGGSGYFDGTGDYLTIADNAAFAFGANPFTVEFWFYPTLGSTAQYIFDQNPNTANNASFAFLFTTGNAIQAAVFSSTTEYTITSSALPLNQWYHVAMSRSGANYSLFINGSRSGTLGTLSTNSINDSTATVRVGVLGDASNSFPFKGYVSDARIVKGTAVYDPTATTYTIPTAPLTAITNTSLLLNFTNAGITDATAKNDLETVGNAQISTTQSKFGGSSMYFDGTGDWLVYPRNWSINANENFTMEAWIYLTVLPTTLRMILSDSNAGASKYWNISSTGMSAQFGGTSATSADGAFTFAINTWYHVAVVRNGTTVSMYVDGSSITVTNPTQSAAFLETGTVLYVGRFGGTTTYEFNGYIDDLRITKGIARYTQNFTPPTAAFPLS